MIFSENSKILIPHSFYTENTENRFISLEKNQNNCHTIQNSGHIDLLY